MHKRIGLIAGVAALGLAAVAGCTSSGGSGNAGAGSANGGSGGSGAVQLSPAGYIKAALTKASNVKTVHISGTMTSGAFSGTMSGQEQFGSDLKVAMTLNMSQMDMTEVMIGDTVYLKMAQLSSMLGGKPWAEFKLSSLGGSGSAVQSLIDSAKNTDPTQQLQPLLASGDLHKVGTETVDGVQADHYAGTVDPATAFDSSAAAKNLTPDQIAQIKSLMKSSNISTETIDAWVATSTGLPVRETITATASTGAFKVDMHMSQWGQPVTISAPPADQVTDISSEMGNLGGSTS
jgi:hypothetical protein